VLTEVITTSMRENGIPVEGEGPSYQRVQEWDDSQGHGHQAQSADSFSDVRESDSEPATAGREAVPLVEERQQGHWQQEQEQEQGQSNSSSTAAQKPPAPPRRPPAPARSQKWADALVTAPISP
jgi:hypothetical protein